MVIDELISKNNYAKEAWVARGLNPSPESTVTLLVDQLPWDQLDTEEKEFMADVLAPAIESVGLNPWHIF